MPSGASETDLPGGSAGRDPFGGRESRPARLLSELGAAGQSLAVAESCTGGLLGAAITDVPGASAVFRGGAVVYQDDLKRLLLGVKGALLARHGAVSGETARAMASGVRSRLDATWGVAITGIAGPAGGSEEKPVGTVWIAVDGPRKVVRAYRFHGDRRTVRERSVEAALDLLREAVSPAS